MAHFLRCTGRRIIFHPPLGLHRSIFCDAPVGDVLNQEQGNGILAGIPRPPVFEKSVSACFSLMRPSTKLRLLQNLHTCLSTSNIFPTLLLCCLQILRNLHTCLSTSNIFPTLSPLGLLQRSPCVSISAARFFLGNRRHVSVSRMSGPRHQLDLVHLVEEDVPLIPSVQALIFFLSRHPV